jgi:hypothetical protein
MGTAGRSAAGSTPVERTPNDVIAEPPIPRHQAAVLIFPSCPGVARLRAVAAALANEGEVMRVGRRPLRCSPLDERPGCTGVMETFPAQAPGGQQHVLGPLNNFAEVERLGDVPCDRLWRAYDFVGQMRARKFR